MVKESQTLCAPAWSMVGGASMGVAGACGRRERGVRASACEWEGVLSPACAPSHTRWWRERV